ncbi:hypothetical protein [Acinetobacter haemolyticus]|nr:hypothetical protein [Acinetobacter haemolyticus]
MSSNKQLGQHSKRGNALLLDLRDQAIILFRGGSGNLNNTYK